MMTMRQYMNHKDGTYAAIEMAEDSKVQLDNFLEMTLPQMERTDPSTYHTTIIFSTTPVPQAERYNGLGITSFATPVGWEVFKTKNDGNCLVLRLDFPYAQELNQEMTELGATSNYPVYKPHVTVAYDFVEEIDPEELAQPNFPLEFSLITVKPLDMDYVPPNKVK